MRDFAERHYRSLIIAIWLATSLMFLIVARDAIVAWTMGDPDDELRLVQVRDWLAGQSWWDITQYRMNPPYGGPMHWSRLVDVPIAAMIVLLRPFLGENLAEQWASALVPLITYGCVLAMFAATTRRLFGKLSAVLAAAAFFTILPATIQIVPMRIDHHGWQLFCFFWASWAVFDPKRSWIAAAMVGLAMALWIEISIEGLPFAVVFMAVLGLRWLLPQIDSDGTQPRHEQLPIALLVLALASCFLFLGTEGFAQTRNYCDGLSPFHLGAFAAVAAVVGGASLYSRATGHQLSLTVKLAITGVAVISGLAVVLSTAPQCTRDAFAGLDPLVRQYWYNRVPEGLPLWEVQIDFSLPQIFGFVFGCAALLWTLLRTPLPKRDKIGLTVLFLGSAVVGTMVSRTMVYAVCLGVIMAAPIVISAFEIPDGGAGLAKRMGFRIVAILLLLPTMVGQNVMNRLNAMEADAAPKAASAEKAFNKRALTCQKAQSIKKLNILPASQLMIGLDSSPAVLQFTHHKVVATGHHRNQRAMADVIRTFTGTTDEAKAAMQARKADYLVTCDGLYELRIYAKFAPAGFMAKLNQGEIPGWLERQQDIGPFHIYRTNWTAG